MTEQQDKRNSSEPETDHFYVGYLPTPQPHRRFIVLLFTFITFWVFALSTVLVLTQRSPGRAVWLNSNEQSWTGILVESPYPMLIPDDSSATPPLLVVSMGKAGAHESLRGAFDHHVTLRGYALQREGRYMIELAPHPDAIVIDHPIPVEDRPSTQQARTEDLDLVGEIIDGKCYLGAMKPGDGVGHRTCAALCLRGGLPPMFVAESEIGDILYPLLLVDGSSKLDEETIQLVASRVHVHGQLSRIAGLPVLSVNRDDIQPLGAAVTSIP